MEELLAPLDMVADELRRYTNNNYKECYHITEDLEQLQMFTSRYIAASMAADYVECIADIIQMIVIEEDNEIIYDHLCAIMPTRPSVINLLDNVHKINKNLSIDWTLEKLASGQNCLTIIRALEDVHTEINRRSEEDMNFDLINFPWMIEYAIKNIENNIN